MNVRPESRRLLSAQWQNTPNIYPPVETHTRGRRVPSLVWFCLQCVSEYPDQIQLPIKLRYQLATRLPPRSFRLLDSLLKSALSRNTNDETPHTENNSSSIDLSTVDPRLWATVVQIFDHIPPELRTYTIPLNDEHLPLLQGIWNTDSFSLITILELPGCPALTDETIVELKFLHTLAALDASNTEISAEGILSLLWTLQVNDPTEPTRTLRGPWALRVLRLKHCKKMGSKIYQNLPKFPLLSVVDLRGTSCRPQASSEKLEFFPVENRALFSSNLSLSLDALQQYEKRVEVFSASREHQFRLRIKSLCHPSVANAIEKIRRPAPESPNSAQTTRYFGRREKRYYSESVSDDMDTSSCGYGTDATGNQGSSDEDSEDSDVYDTGNGPEPDSRQVYSDDGRQNEEDFDNRVPDEGVPEYEEDWDHDSGGNFALNPDSGIEPLWSFLQNNASDALDFHRPASVERRAIKRQRIFGPVPDPTCVEADSDLSDASFDDDSDYSLAVKPARDAWAGIIPGAIKNQRNLHWYDADRQREYTYVPMSITKGEGDNELMLYRPPRAWGYLQAQLEVIEAKEVKRAQSKANGTGAMLMSVTQNGKKGPDTQQKLRSMAMLAVQRRQMAGSQSKTDSAPKPSKNPFSRKSEIHKPTDDATIDKSLEPLAPLRPISSLRVPDFTHDLLQGNRHSRPTGGSVARAAGKNAAAPANPRTWGPLALPPKPVPEEQTYPSTDLGEERPGRRGTRVSDPLPLGTMSATSSKSARSKKARGSKKDGEREDSSKRSGFDWAAWASKK